MARDKDVRKASWEAFHKRNPEKRAEWAKRWRANNPDYRKDNAQADAEREFRRRVSGYGLSPEQFYALREACRNKCSICGRDRSEQNKDLHIDHDHKTGRVRGLLCGRCNRTLGLLRDDRNLIMAVLEYLTNPPFSRLESTLADSVK